MQAAFHGAGLDVERDRGVVDRPVEQQPADDDRAQGHVELLERGNRSGDHTADSVFFAVGPHVARGRIESASLFDFAPTIAALHGVALPDTDGRVIPGLTVANRERAA